MFGEAKGLRDYGAMDVDSKASLIQEKKFGPIKGLIGNLEKKGEVIQAKI